MTHMPIDQMGYAAGRHPSRVFAVPALLKRIRWARVSALVLGAGLWVPLAMAIKHAF
jgi:hypothetical protein